MRKSLFKFSSLLAMSLVVLTSCQGTTSSTSSLTITLASKVETIDPGQNTSVDGAVYIENAFTGLYTFKPKTDDSGNYITDENGDYESSLEPELFDDSKTVKTTNDDGSVTYTLTLLPDLKWSDGTSYDANAFVYAWNRSVGYDYGYLFEIFKGYEEMTEDATGATKLDVSASADGQELTFTLVSDVPYLDELLAFPAFAPLKESVVDATGAWATSPDTYVSNGAYKLTTFDDSHLVLEKNPYYVDADEVTMDKLDFIYTADETAAYSQWQSKSVDFSDSVPSEEIDDLKANDPSEFFIQGQMGTYYVEFNVADPYLGGDADSSEAETKRELARRGLGLLIDRNHIVNDITKGGEDPANGFVASGITDADGVTEYVDKNGPDEDGSGYYSVAEDDYESNVAEGIELIKEAGYTYDESTGKFTDFPAITYSFNTGTGHQAIAEYLQALYAQYGIDVELSSEEWATFIASRTAGEFEVARGGWIADYNDPITFLDMFTTASGNNDPHLGTVNDGSLTPNTTLKHYSADTDGDGVVDVTNDTWANTYDVLISNIKKESDTAKRFEMIHYAENLLMDTGAVSPLYFYTDSYLKSSDVKGFFSTPNGYKFFTYTTKA